MTGIHGTDEVPKGLTFLVSNDDFSRLLSDLSLAPVDPEESSGSVVEPKTSGCVVESGIVVDPIRG
ncbi:MAG TPA: hypothetical protein VIK42_07210 [Bacteroidales bacterium]